MAKRKTQDGEALSERVGFRLSANEHATYLARVASSGMSASEFFRDCVLTNRTKVVARAPSSVDRKQMLFVVNKAGNNLNQLAHVANTQHLAGKLNESTFVAILYELEVLQQLLKAHLSCVD
jgi:hypothetical protein